MPTNKLYPLFALASVFLVCGCSRPADRDVLYQVSTIRALSAGDYDGETELSALKRHGDFGLGTFCGLDGEMVVLDGLVYQVKADGQVRQVEQDSGIPFAQVTFFDADKEFIVDRELDYAGLKEYLDRRLPSGNIFYALKITGRFEYVKTRSVAKQDKPYRGLGEAVKEQSVFEFRDIEGTIAGFYSPEYSEGFSAGGYHLHFISGNRKSGGHLLDFRASRLKIEIDDTCGFHVDLPDNRNFLGLNLMKLQEKGAKNE